MSEESKPVENLSPAERLSIKDMPAPDLDGLQISIFFLFLYMKPEDREKIDITKHYGIEWLLKGILENPRDAVSVFMKKYLGVNWDGTSISAFLFAEHERRAGCLRAYCEAYVDKLQMEDAQRVYNHAVALNIPTKRAWAEERILFLTEQIKKRHAVIEMDRKPGEDPKEPDRIRHGDA